MTQVDNDVTTIVLEQHQEVARRLDAVLSSPGSARAAEFGSLADLLAAHEHAEESVIYPALRKLGGEGSHVAEDRAKEESAAEQTLKKLKSMDAGSEEFDALFREFSLKVHAHAESEEREVIPLLKVSLPDEQRQSMGQAFRESQNSGSAR